MGGVISVGAYNRRYFFGCLSVDGYISGGGGLYPGELIIGGIFCCLLVHGYISGKGGLLFGSFWYV